ncbi:MAG TPA: hypothetical protein VMV90_06980 [Rectinemataceae bacterium]|nr:hypothetical protein [Rectinemataceae bacterium]
MKREAEDYGRLATELEAGYHSIQELFAKNRRATERIEAGANDELDWAALGFTLHNIYCAFENYFLRVSKFFENGLDQRFWHKDLLDRMTLKIPGIRPRLFSRDYAKRMGELMRFRHAFRNVYEDELDPRRLRILNGDLPSLVADFGPFHAGFIAAIDAVADELGAAPD